MVYDAVGIVLFSLMLVAITGEEPGQAVVRATVSVGGALPLGAAGALLLAPLAHRIRGASLRLSLILGSILLVVGAAECTRRVRLALTLVHHPVFAEASAVVLNVVLATTVVNELVGPVSTRFALQRAGELQTARERV